MDHAVGGRFGGDGAGGGAVGAVAAAGAGGGYSRRAVQQLQQQAPHTSDGLPGDGSGGGGPGGSNSPSRGYKPYTGKVSQEYRELGRLKPDLNDAELLAKRANADRVRMFSRNLNKINQQELAQAAAVSKAAPASPAAAAAPSKAQKARMYAAHVPKPRPKKDDGSGVDGGGADGRGDPAHEEVEELDALALLERQHAEHQRQAAAIRAELGLG